MKGSIDRRAFLKGAGASSIALGSIGALSLPAWAAEGEVEGGRRRHATLVAISKAPTTGRIMHRLVAGGQVRFSAEREVARGGGNFVHWDDSPPVPKPILAAGLWRVTDFLDFDTRGLASAGRVQPGVLGLEVELSDDGSGKSITGEMRIVCNVGFRGLSTGEEEGFRLELEDTPFGPLKFEPFTPPMGLTNITTPD